MKKKLSKGIKRFVRWLFKTVIALVIIGLGVLFVMGWVYYARAMFEVLMWIVGTVLFCGFCVLVVWAFEPD